MTDKGRVLIGKDQPSEERYEYLFKTRFSLPEPWRGLEQERRLDRNLCKVIERFANGEEIISPSKQRIVL